MEKLTKDVETSKLVEGQDETAGQSCVGEQGGTTWADLAEMGDSKETDWSDLAEMAEATELIESTDEVAMGAERIRYDVLTTDDYNVLNRNEQLVFGLDPGLAGRCVALERKIGVNFGKLEEVLGEFGRKEDLEKIDALPDQALVKVAEIYGALGDYCLDGFGEYLFERGEAEISQTYRNYEIIREEFGGLWRGENQGQTEERRGKWDALKLRFLRMFGREEVETGREESRRRLECERFAQTMLLVCRKTELIDDEALRNFAKRAKTEIEQGEASSGVVEIARVCFESRYPLREGVRYIEMRDELEEGEGAINETSKEAQKYVLERFFRLKGLKERDQEYLEETVLPLIDSFDVRAQREFTGDAAGVASPFAEAVFGALAVYESDELGREKMNYALRELIPLADKAAQAMDTDNERLRSVLDRIMIASTMFKEGDDLAKMEEFSGYVREDFAPVLDEENAQFRPCRPSFSGETFFQVARKMTELATVEERREFVEKSVARVREVLPFICKGSNENVEENLRRDLAKKALEDETDKDREEYVRYLENDVDRRIREKDESLVSLLHPRWMRGEERLRNFEFDCLTSRMNPRNLNCLLQRRRELPTSDVYKLEQNRVDALALEGTLLTDHGFIHDEAPKTHELLAAMLKYYETNSAFDEKRGDENLSLSAMQSTTKLDRLVAECQQTGRFGDLARTVFDLRNYEEMVKGVVNDDGRAREYNEPAVEILRRLVTNTEHEKMEAPETQDVKLNQAMKDLWIRQNEETGETEVDFGEVSNLVAYMNEILVKSQNQYGATSTKMVEAVEFTERAATFVLRNISETQRRELIYDPGFKEIVRFNALTASFDEYNPLRFENFWQGVRNVAARNDGMEGAVLGNSEQAYRKIQMKILGQLHKIANQYNQNNQSELVPSLWSGNLSHELIGLTEVRPARVLREWLRERVERRDDV